MVKVSLDIPVSVQDLPKNSSVSSCASFGDVNDSITSSRVKEGSPLLFVLRTAIFRTNMDGVHTKAPHFLFSTPPGGDIHLFLRYRKILV